MTERNPKLPSYQRVGRQSVESDFCGGRLTSDSGLLLLREVDHKLDLVRRIDELIPDPRDPRYTSHRQRELLTARIFAIAAGYEDGNDHQELRFDPAFQVAANKRVDRESPLASPSTLCRLENRITRQTMVELHELLVDIFLESYADPPEEIVLDLDATDDPTYGNQELNYFNGFYDSYCFLPLYVFCNNHLLACYLKPSSVDAAKHAGAICKLLVDKIRSRWPATKIILRGDSGFCKRRILGWCRRNQIGYVFGIQKNPTLLKLLKSEMDLVEARFEAAQEKQRRFTCFAYKARRWKGPQLQVIGKAEHTKKGANPRFVITNLLPDKLDINTPGNSQDKIAIASQEIYEQRYCARGEMENRIKEQQLCLFADRTSCKKFMANQFRLMLSSFAYVLMDGLRRIGLRDTQAKRWRVDTIRLKLIKIAARVRLSVRRIVFHMATDCPFASLYNQVVSHLVAIEPADTS